MRKLALSCAALLFAACAPAALRTQGALVFDGIPKGASDPRARPYFESRFAAFFDWDVEGRGVYIGTRFGDVAQLHHVAKPLGARRQLTFAREPVSAAAAWRGKTPGVLFRKDVGGNEAWQYFFYDPARGDVRLVTDGASRNDGLLVHPSGRKAIFTSTRRNGRDGDLWLMEGDAPRVTRMASQAQGRIYPLDWSRDGRLVLVMRFVAITETELLVLDLDKGALLPLEKAPPAGKVARMAARFSPSDPGVVYFTSNEGGEFLSLYRLERESGRKTALTPNLRWDVDHLALSPDGATLAYTVNEGGASALYLGPTERPAEGKRLPIPMGVIGRIRFDPKGERLALSMTGPRSPTDVHVVDVKSGEVTRWTESEVGGLDTARFVAPELVRWKTFDGLELPAWYYRAPSRSGAKAPVLVLIHGGPESQTMVWFSPFVQYLVAELGIAVLAPNVRGSAGYGKRFVALDDGMKREDSVRDIGTLLDFVKTRPELDPARVAVFGGSYGGYMVLASLVHHGERLRCGVDVVGISNFVTFLRNTKAYRRDLRRVEYGDERDPKMRAFLERISPTTNAHKIRKPLFVVQGANDPRVPESEARQIVRAVRGGGRDVWYLLARDEGHGFRRKGNLVALLEAVGAFLRKHLLP